MLGLPVLDAHFREGAEAPFLLDVAAVVVAAVAAVVAVVAAVVAVAVVAVVVVAVDRILLAVGCRNSAAEIGKVQTLKVTAIPSKHITGPD